MSNQGKRVLSMDGASWRSPPQDNTRKTEGLNRRPLPTHGEKSVAALQRQWLATQQEQYGSVRSSSSSGSSFRSVSPLPMRSRLAFEPGNDESESEEDQDDEERAKEPNYEYPTDDPQSDQSSFMSSPSVVTAPFGSTQEFKVAREGWLYKKNNLMQWRPVYAVAKHGNAIKPGALYLYKDEKFANHIHTYDMSEVVQVEPKKQDYRPGLKWELRLLVKRDDVVLATDNLTTRKDWINSLTSIMGKVSLASHSELQTRTMTAEQLNKQLQSSTGILEQENAQLRQDLAEAQKRIRSQASEHAARESGLTSELELVRNEMEQVLSSKTEEFEQQKMTWQHKAQEWQAQAQQVTVERDRLLDERDRLLDERAELLDERAEWIDERDRIMDDQMMMMNRPRQQQRNDETSLRDIRHQIGSLREQLKQDQVSDGMAKLMDTFDDAQRGWSDLQTDLVKLLKVQGEERDKLLDSFQSEFVQLRDSTRSNYTKLESLLVQLVAKNDDTLISVLQQEQKQWLDEMQTKIMAQIVKKKPMEITQDPQANEKYLIKALASHMDIIKENQDRGREEDDKSFKVLGQLFQHVIQQLDDMPDVNQGLDELSDRLLALDERLHRIQLYSNPDPNTTLDDQDIRELVIGTRSFMERTLRVLDRFGGSQSGLEETVRRAVKNAFNSTHQLERSNDEKLKRYEDNARGYIDKAMSGMRDHLEDYTGVMYKMIEDLILRAVQHLDSTADGDVTDMDRLRKERDELGVMAKNLNKENHEIELELVKKKVQLQAASTEYDHLQQKIQQARQDSLAAMARDLEPLVRQIQLLKQTTDSDDGYIDLGKSDSRRSSRSNGQTPLSTFLNRN